MDNDDVLSFLSPLPSLSDSPAASASDASRHRFVELSDEEFDSALREEVEIPRSSLSLPELESVIEGTLESDRPIAVGGQVRSAVIPDPSLFVPANLLESYIFAAALRYTYLLDTLTPVQITPNAPPCPTYDKLQYFERNEVFAYVNGRSEVVSNSRGAARWKLRDDERRVALLKLLQSGSISQAVESARRDAEAEAAQNKEQSATESPSQSVTVADSVAGNIEQMLWDYLTGHSQPLDKMERGQLLIAQHVVSWLHELSPHVLVPSPQEVSRQLARATLLQPFRHLTGEWIDRVFVSTFQGRALELRRLYNYLSVLPPASFVDRIVRTYEGLADSAWRVLSGQDGHRPLLIYGPGGVGKSSLLAKLLLDHLTLTPPADRFPYVYFDFDLSNLSAREPLTLLAEAARQLGAQYPFSADKWNAARDAWLKESNLSGSGSVEPETRVDALMDFAALLKESWDEGGPLHMKFARGVPFLLVLDTFEELQYHDREHIKNIFRFLNICREHLSTLRVILMGRAPLGDLQQEYHYIESIVLEGDDFGTGQNTDFSVIELPLQDLDKDAALEYLELQGISDADLAEELIEVVGQSPLSLRLIVRVFKEGRLDLKSLRDQTDWRRGISDWLRGRKVPPRELLQGVLFDRILGHIHTPKVKELAHPGLVLRRITPELIKEVLAGPCGLGELTDEEAQWYFDQLAKEVSLVGTDRDAQEGEAVLRHRPEIRQIMLRLMAADETKSQQIRQVHENAVKYYEARSGRLAEEEALYHRLMLNSAPPVKTLLDDVPTEEAIDAGYAPQPETDSDPQPVWRALAQSREELPLAGSAYLAARLNQEFLPDAAWETVNQEDWELMTLGRASRRARVHENVVSALEGLRLERSKMRGPSAELSPLSPLPLIEVAFLERLGRYEETELYARQAIAALKNFKPELGFRRIVEYSLLAARSAASAKLSEACVLYLQQTEAARVFAEREEMEAGTVNLRLKRQCLRFKADCYRLTHDSAVYEILVDCLLRFADDAKGLQGHPVLARYALSGAVSYRAAKESDTRPQYYELLEKVWRPPLLPMLLENLPERSAEQLAKVLAKWTRRALDEGASVEQLRQIVEVPARSKDASQLRERWQLQLLNNYEYVGARLADAFDGIDISTHDVAELCEALTPKLTGKKIWGDPFDEARRAGDLIPGEGPPVSSIKHSTPELQ